MVFGGNKIVRVKLVMGLFLIAFFMTLGSVTAANWTVNQGDNIQSVIDNASDNDTIIINGTHQGVGNCNLTVNRSVSIVGADSAVVDAQGQGNMFTIPSGVVVTISNITFLNGNAGSSGAGGIIYNAGTLNVIGCTFRNNTAFNGGAVVNVGTLTVTDSSFISNTAGHDGAALNNLNTLTVINCNFLNNSASHVAGGIMNWHGTLNVTGSSFTGNTATTEGSAISNYGPANINFNRIVGNGNYQLYNSNSAVVNATNNWWGQNNGPVVSSTSPSDIYIASGTVTYDPWIVLSVTSTPDEIYGSEAVLTAVLTHNNNGDNTSSQGHVPEGMPVNFATNRGNITDPVYTRNGKATAILNNLQSGTANVTATLDNQSVSTQVTKQVAQAFLNITADVLVLPYPCTTGLNINYGINLTDPVTWVSIAYRHVDEPGVGEIDVIVNGNIVLTKYFVNSYFFWMDNEEWWCNYPDPSIWGLEFNPDLFMDYARRLNFAEQNGLDFGAICHEMYNNPYLTNGDCYMAYYHRDSFKDNIQTILTYPGGSLTKNSTITYINGQDAGFEIIQSFAITTGKVTDDMVQYWLNQNSTYPIGHVKASYGTFMTSLTTLWLSDKLADEMASQLNVTWSRSTPTVVMCGVTNGTGYLNCLDPAMGMNVVGDVNNTKSFKFVCSLMLSEVERMALGSTGVSVDSTLSRIVSEVLSGATFDTILDPENNTLTLMLEGNDIYKIIIDLNTGVVRDILNDQGLSLKGAETTSSAYCYHDQLTDNQYQIDNGLLHLGADVAGGAAVSAGVLILLAGGPPGLAALLLIGGGVACFYAAGVFEDPDNPRTWIKGAVSIGIAAIPGGLEAKELIYISETPWLLMKSGVISTGGKYVFKATAGGSFAEGTHDVAIDCLTSYTLNDVEDRVMDYMGVPTHF